MQALIPELHVESLDKAILDRFAWLDEAQPPSAPVGPVVQGLAGELRPVVPS
jgi:hypothetical protein